MKATTKISDALRRFLKLFTNNWLLKLFSLILAVLLYYAVSPNSSARSGDSGRNGTPAAPNPASIIETILKPTMPIPAPEPEKAEPEPESEKTESEPAEQKEGDPQ